MSDVAQPQSRIRVRGGLGSARYLVTHRKLLTRVVTIAELRAFVPARRSIARTTFAEVTP